MAEEVSRKPYVREITSEWIFRHPRYLRYMVREFSCLFIGGWTLLMVWGLKQLAEGPAAWAAFLDCLKSPASIVFHVLALAFAGHWLVKVAIAGVVFLSLWSAAHRLRITCYDLGIRADTVVATILYAGALAGTGASVLYLARI